MHRRLDGARHPSATPRSRIRRALGAAGLAIGLGLAGCGGGGGGSDGATDGGTDPTKTDSGVRGTLTVSGGAAAQAGGSFVVTPGYFGNGVEITPASCLTAGTTSVCNAGWKLSAFEVAGTKVEQVTVVLVSGSTTPPGPEPGSPPLTMLVGFGIVDGATTISALFAARCEGNDRSVCASVSDLGVTLDLTARTLTFANVRVVDENDATRSVTLDGVLQF